MRNSVKISRSKMIEFVFNDKYENIDKSVWEKFNNNSNNGSVFQSPKMFEFWNLQVGSNPFVFSVSSKEGELLALCTGVIMATGVGIIKYLSRRAIIFGGPIIYQGDKSKEAFTFLLKKMNQKISKKAIYLETRNSSNYNDVKDTYNINGWDYLPYQNYIIKLNSQEEVFKLFTSEKRRQIRKGIKEGVEISYENTADNVKGVYSVIEMIYSKKVKKPIPKLDFFLSLINQDFANVIAIIYNNKIIGGGFFIYDGKNIYDWYRGGLDSEFKHQFPSIMTAWGVMLYGIKNGIEKFDFMGAGLKGKEYGVRKFKSQFGGELVEDGRFIKILNPFLYRIGIMGLKIFKR